MRADARYPKVAPACGIEQVEMRLYNPCFCAASAVHDSRGIPLIRIGSSTSLPVCELVYSVLSDYVPMIRSIAWTFLLLTLAAAVVSQVSGCCMVPMPAAGAAASGATCPVQGSPPAQAGTARGGTCSFPSVPQEPASCSGPAQQVLMNGRGATGNVSGIRRIYAKNVLDNRERAAIYALIVAKPGIDLTGIAHELRMNRQTLRYHLNLMESLSKIIAIRDRGIVRHYENHGRYGIIECNVFRHLWNPTAERILSLIRAVPGITQSEIAMHLAITPSTVRWHMRRLREDGIVTEQHEGRYTRYALTDEARLVASQVRGRTDGIAVMNERRTVL